MTPCLSSRFFLSFFTFSSSSTSSSASKTAPLAAGVPTGSLSVAKNKPAAAAARGRLPPTGGMGRKWEGWAAGGGWRKWSPPSTSASSDLPTVAAGAGSCAAALPSATPRLPLALKELVLSRRTGGANAAVCEVEAGRDPTVAVVVAMYRPTLAAMLFPGQVLPSSPLSTVSDLRLHPISDVGLRIRSYPPQRRSLHPVDSRQSDMGPRQR